MFGLGKKEPSTKHIKKTRVSMPFYGENKGVYFAAVKKRLFLKNKAYE